MTQLTSHFSLEELTHTEQRGLDNTCPPELLPELLETAKMMERIRSVLAVPVFVSSGYRSLAVNAAVGGSARSDHVKAMAVDFKAPQFGTPYQVCKLLAGQMDSLGIGQVILEYNRWIHVSRNHPTKVINRVITISSAGTEVGIQVVT